MPFLQTGRPTGLNKEKRGDTIECTSLEWKKTKLKEGEKRQGIPRGVLNLGKKGVEGGGKKGKKWAPLKTTRSVHQGEKITNP